MGPRSTISVRHHDLAVTEEPRLRVLGSEAAFVVHGLDGKVGPRIDIGARYAVLTRWGKEEPVAILPGR